MPKDTKRLDISLLESQVVLTINNIGWHAYLWFPVVQREILSFGLDDADEKVHAAIVGLVKKGALMVAKAYLGRDPRLQAFSKPHSRTGGDCPISRCSVPID